MVHVNATRQHLPCVDVMMGEMGVSGVFVDGALWDYGGGPVRITGPDGKIHELHSDGEQELTLRPGAAG